MKKLALLSLVLILVAVPALALPGPDPVTGPFSITITNINPDSTGLNETMDELEFDRSFPGWDFGDREGYRCAYVERFGAGNQLLYTVTIEVFHPDSVPGDAGVWGKINDKNGPDSNNNDSSGPDDYCGVPGPAAAYNGEDHFPHMTHPGDGLSFSDGGFIPLDADPCARSYWTPGDEPGESILWWDEDGPTFAHGPGEGDLGCGGGPLEPDPVARMNVQMFATGISFCTVSQHEQQCSGAAPTTTASPTPTATTTAPPPPPTTTAPPPTPTVTETVTQTVTETVTETVTPALCAEGSGSDSVTVTACPG